MPASGVLNSWRASGGTLQCLLTPCLDTITHSGALVSGLHLMTHLSIYSLNLLTPHLHLNPLLAAFGYLSSSCPGLWPLWILVGWDPSLHSCAGSSHSFFLFFGCTELSQGSATIALICVCIWSLHDGFPLRTWVSVQSVSAPRSLYEWSCLQWFALHHFNCLSSSARVYFCHTL